MDHLRRCGCVLYTIGSEKRFSTHLTEDFSVILIDSFILVNYTLLESVCLKNKEASWMTN